MPTYTGNCKTPGCAEIVAYVETIVMGIKVADKLREGDIFNGDSLYLECQKGHRHPYTVKGGELK